MTTLPPQINPQWRPNPESAEMSMVTQIRPISLLSGNNRVEFIIPKYKEYCVDLAATKLAFSFKVTKEDGTKPKIDQGKHIATINSMLDTMFSQISIKVNNEQITSCSNSHIVSFFSKYLNYSSEYRRSVLTSNRFFESAAGQEGKIAGKSYQDLEILVKDAATCKCIGPLPHPFFATPKLLPPGVELNIALTQTNSDLFLFGDISDKVKVNLTDVYLLVRLIKLESSILSSINEGLNKSAYIIPFKNTVVKSYTLPKGETSVSIYSLFYGNLPNRVFCLQVPTAAFLGTLATTPLVFVHNDLKSYSFNFNGVNVPVQKVEFAIPGDGIDLFHHVNNVLGLNKNQHTSPGITYDKYISDLFFIAENLDSDCSVSNATLPFTPGTLSLTLDFAKALTDNTTLVVIAEFAQSYVQIDKHGAVKMIEK
jgi:hypothetical protein